jgi:YD repeat-containing protein
VYGYRYDAVGILVKRTDPLGTQAAYEYTADYQIERITKTRGTRSGTASYAYDPAGNLISAAMDGVGAEYTVNAYGDRLSVSRGAETVKYSLDIGGKLKGVSVRDGAATLSSVNYDYRRPAVEGRDRMWMRSSGTEGQPTSEQYSKTHAGPAYHPAGPDSRLSKRKSRRSALLQLHLRKAGTVGKRGSYAYDALNGWPLPRRRPFLTTKNTRRGSDTDYGGTKPWRSCAKKRK